MNFFEYVQLMNPVPDDGARFRHLRRIERQLLALRSELEEFEDADDLYGICVTMQKIETLSDEIAQLNKEGVRNV
jgi:hypothetical protein